MTQHPTRPDRPSPPQPVPGGAPPALAIGLGVRHARMTLGLRLQDVATLAGCSESLVSKVENGRALPSLTTLHRLAAALQTTVGRLCATPDAGDEVVSRRGQRPVVTMDPLRRGPGIRMERLIPYGPAHLLQGNIHIVEPGGGSEGSLSHEGEEVGFVLEGALELTVDGHAYALEAEDSFRFRSNLPHGYRNLGARRARVIFINTPPSF